ncbi:MAG TPA: PHB depolymerase family esterase [Cyclobacteriaceae bacterium]|nr:PHB depolymerase family esterase [Cyclobacteriaceae bacterium]
MKIVILIVVLSTLMNTTSMSNKLPLTYLVREPKIRAAKPPLLILLHGVGSNEKDLFSFADQLPDQFLVISVRAPITLDSNRFAWYQVDFSTGKPVFNKGQEERSRQLILDFIDQLNEHHSFDPAKVYLAGFSQGAIMSYSVALTHPEKVRGIAIMSGRLLEEIKPIIVSPIKLQQLSIFISHGTQDGMLTVQYARESLKFLESLNLNPTYKEYFAGHGINADMRFDLIAWLNKV